MVTLRDVLPFMLSVLIGPLVALGISKLFADMRAMLARAALIKGRGGDALSPRGDAMVLTRSLVGSTAAMIVSRLLFAAFQAPLAWSVVPAVWAVLMLGDVFILWQTSRFSASLHGEARAAIAWPARRQGIARIVGDSLGAITGMVLLFA